MTGEKQSQLTGLVLSNTPYRNDSAVVSVATERGIKSVLASHAYSPRSKLKPLLLPLSLVEVDGREGEGGLFLARESLSLFDPTLLYSGAATNPFLQLLVETASDYFRYDDPYPLGPVKEILLALSQGKDHLSLALLTYGVLYEAMGLEEKTDGCARCGKTDGIVSYSLEEGGFLCGDCLNQVPGARKKDAMDLYVLKFAFLPVTRETLGKTVPKESGLRVLKDLAAYLSDYFDLPLPRSLPLLLSALAEERA